MVFNKYVYGYYHFKKSVNQNVTNPLFLLKILIKNAKDLYFCIKLKSKKLSDTKKNLWIKTDQIKIDCS
jgi:hypothetical protein